MKGTEMKKVLSIAALVAGLAGAALSLPALAQHHGGGGFGFGFFGMGKIKSQLNLSPDQQTQWDALTAQMKSARQAMRQNHQQLHQALQAELAKPEPDLAALATLGDSLRQQSQATHQQIRNGWLQLYATFTPSQKAVVKDAMLQRMQKMQQFHDKMMSRQQGG
jgi:Spy/CpxP family protein refolding chaperone